MKSLSDYKGIRTFTGLDMDVFNPTMSMICIEDIAHALANQCRFGGHLPKFFSVAQHCCLCASMVPDEYKLETLLHDASEAYLLDIPTPIKKGLTNYYKIEHNLMAVIAKKFGFEWPINKVVKEVDESALQFEWEFLMMEQPTKIPFECWSPVKAERLFLEIYHKLK